MKNTETHFELVLENCPNVRMQLDDTDKVVEALKMGIRDYTFKPIKVDVFGNKVNGLLKSKFHQE